ncbi:MAG: hypothetical protein H6700_10745 [Myxococcales bacterium]|nr:hypothetical protein [Myxococcales bacterium]
MKRAMELAYYREARNRGLTMREMVELMSVSMRKISQLSNDLKTTYARAAAQPNLERRIISLLLAGPMTRARIVQALAAEEEADVEAVLAGLVAERRVAVTDDRTPRFALTAQDYRLVKEPWQQRIDGLDHLCRTLASVVEQRFFGDSDAAFARTVALRIGRAQLDELRALYEERVFSEAVALERAAADDDALSLNIAIMWGEDEERT